MDPVFLSLLVIFITSLIAYAFHSISRKKLNLPPEPIGFPLLGHLPFLQPKPHIAHTQYKKYGPICTLRMGMTPYVLLNSYKAINEAFAEQADNFAGRPQNKFIRYSIHDSGIIFTDGSLWKEHRRFALRLMREFGSNTPMGEQIVQEECQAMKERLFDLAGAPVNTRAIYTSGINNMISRLVFGEQNMSNDPDFKQFEQYLDYSKVVPKFFDMLPAMFPWMTTISPLMKLHQCFASDHQAIANSMNEFIKQKIDQHKEALQKMDLPPTELKQANDICEAFIVEQSKQEASKPGEHTFTDYQLIRNMLDLFIAGTESTSATLRWATLLLALHPEIQTRLQREIDETIGRERTPTLADRLQLPYLRAVLDEVLRYSSVMPMALGHKTLTNTQLMGYNIPANTTVVSNIHGVHYDQELWKKPEEFYPEHFLSPTGEYCPSKYLIQFSIGKRACPAKFLGWNTLFLALVTLLQAFEIRLADPKMNIEKVVRGTGDTIRSPLPHDIIFSPLTQVSAVY